MTIALDSALPRKDQWLQDLIRERESARLDRQMALPAGQREASLKTENFPQPQEGAGFSPFVYVSRNLWQFCLNTLNYIGEHPLQFALSVGTAMAVRWAVGIGIGVLSGGAIAGLGLAIASAMVTSVVLGTGRALMKGDTLKAEDVAGRALFSGLIAGVIGAFIAGHLPTPHSAEPSSIHTATPPHATVVPSHPVTQPPHPTVVETSHPTIIHPQYTPLEGLAHTGAGKVTDQP